MKRRPIILGLVSATTLLSGGIAPPAAVVLT
jgi:hypothetical protein